MAPAAGDRHGFRRDEWNEPGSVGHVDDRGYRAPLLRKPRLLLLDEPTAHLDGGALYQVGIALKWPMAGRTTFLIVHRLETIQLADRILLLDRGRLLATGTHEALWAQSVLQRKLLAAIDYIGLKAHKAD
jgi:ABC-type transport system involved in cytochrome bd biosynthesis fused ATPase/permease subunit